MAGPMKMRAILASGYTDVRVLMTHPMATEQQTKGNPHFIQNLTVKVNGKTVVDAQISQAVSRNPVFSFRLKGGAKAGAHFHRSCCHVVPSLRSRRWSL